MPKFWFRSPKFFKKFPKIVKIFNLQILVIYIYISGSPVPPISPVSPVNLLYFGNPNFASYIFQKTPVSPVFSKYSPRTSYKKMKKFPAFYKYHKSLWLMTCISHNLILIKCHFFIYYYVLMSSKLRYWLIFGWSYMHPECRKMYHFASRFQKISGGDTPWTPFLTGSKRPVFQAFGPQRASKLVEPPFKGG